LVLRNNFTADFLAVAARFVAFSKIYGLKQSARSWNTAFSNFLKAHDLLMSSADPCISFPTTALRLIQALRVDDGLAMCQDQALLTKMISHLISEFEVSLGDAEVYVGLHITRDLSSRKLYIDQQWFTETSLIKYGSQDGNTVSHPCDPHISLSYPPDSDRTLYTSFFIPRNCGFFALLGHSLATRHRKGIFCGCTVCKEFSQN
jgi:hypothetical protein